MNIHGWCPLFSTSYSDGKDEVKCRRNDCAWWDENNDSCVVWSIKDKLDTLD